MKIIVNTISTKLHSGGAYQIAQNFLKATLSYPTEDVEWYYITSADVDAAVGQSFAHLRDENYFVFPTQPDFLHTYRKTAIELRRLESLIKPDLVYTISAPCYFSFRVPEVMRFANAWVTNPNHYAWSKLTFYEKLRMRLYSWNQRRMLKKAQYIITQSNTVRNGLLKITKLNDYRVQVVANVLPKIFENISPLRALSEDGEIHIACIAAPVPHKNLDIIPAVIFSLINKYRLDNVIFHVTIPESSSVWREISRKAKLTGVEEKIVNHGRCNQNEIAEIYRISSIAFLPSLLETFSASSLEAMYFGLHVIASDFSFNREVLADSAHYYPPTDAEAAAEAIFNCINIAEKSSEKLRLQQQQLKKYRKYENHYYQTVSCLKNFLK